ncbi:MAG: hypothetical protein KC535_02975 [Nanoarchaeota archaeon]|nr:hypothetical protein [Nanoarchaeota archaeon]
MENAPDTGKHESFVPLGPQEIPEDIEEDVYKREYVDDLLEDDELSFEEAAFMTGYCDFA